MSWDLMSWFVVVLFECEHIWTALSWKYATVTIEVAACWPWCGSDCLWELWGPASSLYIIVVSLYLPCMWIWFEIISYHPLWPGPKRQSNHCHAKSWGKSAAPCPWDSSEELTPVMSASRLEVSAKNVYMYIHCGGHEWNVTSLLSKSWVTYLCSTSFTSSIIIHLWIYTY